MLSLRDIQRALVTTLSKCKYDVSFDEVIQADRPFFYIDLSIRSKSFDDVYFDRYIQVDIMFTPQKKNGRIQTKELYLMADELEKLIRPIFFVEDRAITVMDVEQTIVDGILHYIFDLDFTDAFTDEEQEHIQYELMGELEVHMNYVGGNANGK
ncbi:phage tail terminator family protein [Veillonella magna]|uniref:Phage protein n=1 Tax=Veillonella magna TaxID=464322 RepID=A0ABS2GH14_9FIRM|nr:hypothetical protein [Veillonella magna]MBM6824791.1 hypothetical protein [Veillonella magna]MBM6913130.1 hypothetical protein [Veillonella magna]